MPKTLTPKQKKLAAMYGDKTKITRGDIITAAKKKAGTAKRGKTKMTKAEKGKTKLPKLKLDTLTPSRITGLMEKFSRMSDQDRALFQSMLGKGMGKFGKALDKAALRGRMSDQDLAMPIFSQMKKAAGTRKKKKTTARRAGGLTAAVKKIKTGARRRGGTGRGR
tara:strand:- start:79 stop:573 length:495 start_codon:yes stop_codon:yes gene_type:complete